MMLKVLHSVIILGGTRGTLSPGLVTCKANVLSGVLLAPPLIQVFLTKESYRQNYLYYNSCFMSLQKASAHVFVCGSSRLDPGCHFSKKLEIARVWPKKRQLICKFCFY